MKTRIAEILKTIPKLPGIYIMKDTRGKILYIGKAKVLDNRVRSYFQSSRHLPLRVRIFVDKVRDIKFLTTKTETEALILESNFIKKHQPRYNVLLKDDKHYPYLRLTMQELFPRLEVVRRLKKDGATYFGPYTMVKEVRETLRLIYQIFSTSTKPRPTGWFRSAAALPELSNETLPRALCRLSDTRGISTGGTRRYSISQGEK